MRKWITSALAFLSIATGYPSCKSDSGEDVDMWLALKGPKGTNYAYWDSNTALGLSSHDMNSTSVGALGLTLQQLWSETSTQYIMWNDSPPPESSSYNYTTGHTKGVWAWNPSTGDAIILQHSVPLFPLGPGQTAKYLGLGSNAWMYGQHAACFAVNTSDLESLANLAVLTIPSIYDARVDDTTSPALLALAQGATSENPLCENTSFQTRGGVNITYFAKSTQWNNELYSACLAPQLGVSLDVESWIRGSAVGPSCSSEEDVLDIQGVSYPGGLEFSEYNDHSKWAVGTTWFCPSDINRMTTQYARGGAAYCFQDLALASDMKKAITSTNTCA